MKRFKKQLGMVLAKLINKRYTIKNVRNQQKLVEYIQAIICHTKEANIDAIYNQLTFAYKNIITKL